jgi:hypothetical protein
MLTIIHNDDMIRTGDINHTTNEPVVKPLCVVDYNSNMGAVDKTDMQLSFSECIRKTVKWCEKLFFSHFGHGSSQCLYYVQRQNWEKTQVFGLSSRYYT